MEVNTTRTVLTFFSLYAFIQVTKEVDFTGIWIFDVVVKGFLCISVAGAVNLILMRVQNKFKK